MEYTVFVATTCVLGLAEILVLGLTWMQSGTYRTASSLGIRVPVIELILRNGTFLAMRSFRFTYLTLSPAGTVYFV